MKILVSNRHYFYYPMEYFIESTEKIGAKDIDFYGMMPHIWIDHYEYVGCEKIVSMLKEHCRRIQIFSPKSYNYCLYAPEEYHRDITERYYKNCILAAKQLGAEYMTLTLSGGYYDYACKQMRKVAENSLLELGEVANKCGVKILLETEPAVDSILLNSLEQMKYFWKYCKDVSGISVNMKTIEDNGELIEVWLDVFGDDITYISFDGNFDEKVIAKNGYKGITGVRVNDDGCWDNPRDKDLSMFENEC